MFNSWLSKLNRKYGRYAIHNLMLYIVIGQAVVFAADLILGSAGFNLSSLLYFSLPDIIGGQIWRLITFIFVPPNTNIIWALLAMYLSWLLGSALEMEWGAFKFNMFYLTGVIGTILGGLITQYTMNVYLNMSLFLAFAIIFPDYELLLFFILPIKVKYLALADILFLLVSLAAANWAGKVAILASILNLILYFGPQIIGSARAWQRRAQWKRKYR